MDGPYGCQSSVSGWRATYDIDSDGSITARIVDKDGFYRSTSAHFSSLDELMSYLDSQS